jgi:molybdenum cofactor cytidylyltransferase
VDTVAGIVLAAGTSSRLGQPKQLLAYGGRSLVQRVAAVGLAAELVPLIVVTGAHAAAVERELEGLPVQIVRNPDYRAGQSTSVRAGVGALPPTTGAVVMLLVDMPGVDEAVVRALVAAWRATRAPLVRPTFEGKPGNPVLFAASLFPEMLALAGDEGGRPILQRHAARVRLVPTTQPGVLLDVDTWDAYARLLANESPAPEPARGATEVT